MTKHYCDICNKQMYSPNQISILIGPSFAQHYDVCGDCQKAINDAKDKAEIETIKRIRSEKE